MKHIKNFKSKDTDLLIDWQNNFKKLMNHLIEIFSKAGYDYDVYLNNTDFEVDIKKQGSLCLSLSFVKYQPKFDVILSVFYTYDMSDIEIILNYLRSADGLKSNENYFQEIFIVNDTVDNIIDKIKIQDIEILLSTNKYNL